MRFIKLTFFIALIGAFLGFSSCGPENNADPSIEEAQLKLLSKTWNISEVKFGTTSDRLADFTGTTLTISDSDTDSKIFDFEFNKIPTAPEKGPWPKDGQWEFSTSSPESVVTRLPDLLPITYTVTATTLTLNFTYAGPGFSGRTSAIEGAWMFKFTN
jgi:hypothetical protein